MTIERSAHLAAIVTAACPALASAGLAGELERIIAQARRAWPTVDLAPEAFVADLAAHLLRQGDAASALAALHTADLYLASACARGVPKAIAAFDKEYLTLTGSWIARVDRSPDFVDEVSQRLRERLLVGPRPRIADYDGSGPLASWARVAAARLALNLRRGRQREVPLEIRDAAVVEPEPEMMRNRYRAEVEAAFKTALSRLEADERELLRLHHLQGVPLHELGKQRGVDKSTMSRRIAAVRRALLAETRRELARLVPAMTTATRDSLLLAMRSRIDVSLATALKR
jgi:RNA polymerase sigma-70 factor (ECF subfamily)